MPAEAIPRAREKIVVFYDLNRTRWICNRPSSETIRGHSFLFACLLDSRMSGNDHHTPHRYFHVVYVMHVSYRVSDFMSRKSRKRRPVAIFFKHEGHEIKDIFKTTT